jgi:hypothetical protein
MLFALLDEHDPAIEEQLRADNASLAGVHAEVKRALGTGEGRIWEGILLTPRVRKIIALAGTQAGDRDIDPIDLFDAIRAEGGGLAASILTRARNSAHAAR